MSKKKGPAAAPLTTTIARLDANGIYLGTEEIALADLAETHVHLPDGCDLEPGKYRWDAEQDAFKPMRKGEKPKVEEVFAMNAIALGFMALYEEGFALPEETLAWLRSQARSIDFIAKLTPESNELANAFRNIK